MVYFLKLEVFNVLTYLLLKQSVKTHCWKLRLDHDESSDLIKICLKAFQQSYVGVFVGFRFSEESNKFCVLFGLYFYKSQ